ncbi:MAG: RnfH family protein [Gammaproteobacteria bacterium]|nr:RnfH family protein [Gammaproteobacteria bacterium]
MTESISVEVVFALPDRQKLVSVSLQAGATVADAIGQSKIHEQFPGQPLDRLPVGIWGHPVERGTRLKDGDRVEIYRELRLDPRDARRARAQAGLTMRKSADA